LSVASPLAAWTRFERLPPAVSDGDMDGDLEGDFEGDLEADA
jgi:hypothetical protein